MGSQIGTFVAGLNTIALSPAIREMLRRALALGNYLNGTSPRGAAYGFRLESLLKLGNVRGSDSSSNLLDYFTSYLMSFIVDDDTSKMNPDACEKLLDEDGADEEDKMAVGKTFQIPKVEKLKVKRNTAEASAAKAAIEWDISNLLGACIRDLISCSSASKLSFSQLKGDFRQLQQRFDGVAKAVQSAVDSGKEQEGEEVQCLVLFCFRCLNLRRYVLLTGNQELIDKMSPFVEDADEAMQTLKQELDKVEWRYTGIAKAFGEDPRKIELEEFIDLFAKFGQELQGSAEKLAKELKQS